MSRRTIQAPSNEDIYAVLSLWALRLTCLRRIHHFSILASEANALFSQLPPCFDLPGTPSSHANYPVFDVRIPFDITLLKAALPSYLGGDLYLALQSLQEIAYACKLEFRRTQDSVWLDRLQVTALAIASVLIQLREIQQAVDLLEELFEATEDPQFLQALCLAALELGDLRTSEQVISKLESINSNKPVDVSTLRLMQKLCQGQWKEAEAFARSNLEDVKGDYTRRVNLAVCCMYTGQVQEVGRNTT